MDDNVFIVGIDRWWHDWFHDAVSKNKIITFNMGKCGNGEQYCYVHAPACILIAKEGDAVRRLPSGQITVEYNYEHETKL